ncbi:MAG TPA: site-specific integrase [Sphingobium sp.]
MAQERAMLTFLEGSPNPLRNRVIFLLSMRAGLRAKEIAGLTWDMVTDAEGHVCDTIELRDSVTKGNSGGTIPIARDLKQSLSELKIAAPDVVAGSNVVVTQRRQSTSAQVVVNMFSGWYRALGFDGCSSHSGRRTFITRAARNIGRFGGSLRDVQELARHRSIGMTQRYIEVERDAIRKVVDHC